MDATTTPRPPEQQIAELLKLLAPHDLDDLIEALFDIRKRSGYGMIGIKVANSRVAELDVTYYKRK